MRHQENVERFDEFYTRALEYANEGKEGAARQLLERAIDGAPEDPRGAQVEAALRAAEIRKLQQSAEDGGRRASSRQLSYQQLARLDPERATHWRNQAVLLSAAVEREKRIAAEQDNARARERARSYAQLEIVDWNWARKRDVGWVEVQGRVTNVSGAPMRNVTAVVTWETSSGQLVTTESALIDLNPILDGQTSTFSLLERLNPAMHSAKLSFRTLGGGSIPTRKRE